MKTLRPKFTSFGRNLRMKPNLVELKFVIMTLYGFKYLKVKEYCKTKTFGKREIVDFNNYVVYIFINIDAPLRRNFNLMSLSANLDKLIFVVFGWNFVKNFTKKFHPKIVRPTKSLLNRSQFLVLQISLDTALHACICSC
jgi:hypothetical protein